MGCALSLCVFTLTPSPQALGAPRWLCPPPEQCVGQLLAVTAAARGLTPRQQQLWSTTGRFFSQGGSVSPASRRNTSGLT